MDNQILMYIIYLLASIFLTFWVGRNLFKNGQVFLDEVFVGNKELSKSVNKLLLTGFYLINFGFVVYALTVNRTIDSLRGVFEVGSQQIGKIILVLGLLHFGNLIVFFNLRKKANQKRPIKTTILDPIE